TGKMYEQADLALQSCAAKTVTITYLENREEAEARARKVANVSLTTRQITLLNELKSRVRSIVASMTTFRPELPGGVFVRAPDLGLDEEFHVQFTCTNQASVKPAVEPAPKPEKAKSELVQKRERKREAEPILSRAEAVEARYQAGLKWVVSAGNMDAKATEALRACEDRKVTYTPLITKDEEDALVDERDKAVKPITRRVGARSVKWMQAAERALKAVGAIPHPSTVPRRDETYRMEFTCTIGAKKRAVAEPLFVHVRPGEWYVPAKGMGQEVDETALSAATSSIAATGECADSPSFFCVPIRQEGEAVNQKIEDRGEACSRQLQRNGIHINKINLDDAETQEGRSGLKISCVWVPKKYVGFRVDDEESIRVEGEAGVVTSTTPHYGRKLTLGFSVSLGYSRLIESRAWAKEAFVYSLGLDLQLLEKSFGVNVALIGTPASGAPVLVRSDGIIYDIGITPWYLGAELRLYWLVHDTVDIGGYVRFMAGEYAGFKEGAGWQMGV
ncbi:MAG: hypothetical protein AABY13_01895, partial [Nanoarchaeota archaeon]